MERGAAVSVARSKLRLWRLLSAAGATHGHRRRAHHPTKSMAEPLRRAVDREYPPRVPGPRACPARATSATAPDPLLCLLSPVEDASVAGDGLSGASPSPCSG